MRGHSLILMNIKPLSLIYMDFYESEHIPDLNRFLSYVEDEKLRRIIVEIGMIAIHDEISDQELLTI